MTNEMKLLMALCDALGFEVEVVTQKYYMPDGSPQFETFGSCHGADEKGLYRIVDTSYKLTRKKTETPKPIPE